MTAGYRRRASTSRSTEHLPPLPLHRPQRQATLEDQHQILMARHRQLQAEISRRRQASSHNRSPTTTQTPAYIESSRQRSMPAGWPYRHLGERVQQAAFLHGSIQTVQEAVERLNRASSTISSALNQPVPRTRSSNASARESVGEMNVSDAHRRKTKRRKLKDEPLAKSFGPNYGHRGQVISGPLRMEIDFCDGGLHEESALGSRDYIPENVLINNKDVYCTRSSKCDLVLRHMGSASFCLQKIVIKAPETGFTAPIQEGMIFVAMDNEGLIQRTSRYKPRISCPLSPPLSRSPSRSPDLLNDRYPALDSDPLREVDNDRPSSRRADDGTQRRIPPPMNSSTEISLQVSRPRYNRRHSHTPLPHFQGQSEANAGQGSVTPNSSGLFDTPGSSNAISQSRPAGVPILPHFNVTMDCDPRSDDEEDSSNEATLFDRRHRHVLRPLSDSSDDADSPPLTLSASDQARSGRRSSHRRRNGRRTCPSLIEIEASPNGSQDNREKDVNDILAPHARFFIEKDKSMVSVRFDPPM